MTENAQGWYLVTSRVGKTFITPQFAVGAASEDEAVRIVTETSIRELNQLLPKDQQLTVGTAERIS